MRNLCQLKMCKEKVTAYKNDQFRIYSAEYCALLIDFMMTVVAYQQLCWCALL